jgi:hypothetical protein
MLRIFSLIFIFVFSMAGSSLSYAVDANTNTDTIAELSLKTVTVLDSASMRVSFSDNVDLSSLVLKIVKQSDSSSVSIDDIIEVADTPDSVDVILKDELEEGSSYTLTVLAAIGTSGSTIIDGAGALREFVTPSPLKKASATLNAPPNPSAVTVDEGQEEEVIEDTPQLEPVEEETPVPTEELPLT